MKEVNENYKKLFVNINASKSLNYIIDVFPNPFALKSKKDSNLITDLMEKIETKFCPDKSVRGKIFEYLFMLVLLRKNISPFFYQAKMTYVPNVIFDFILFQGNVPIAISLKTSARERYKQVELEALVLKQVHKNAKCIFLLYNYEDVRSLEVKKRNFEISYIDEIISSQTSSFDKLIKKLINHSYTSPERVDVVKGIEIG